MRSVGESLAIRPTCSQAAIGQCTAQRFSDRDNMFHLKDKEFGFRSPVTKTNLADVAVPLNACLIIFPQRTSNI